MNELSLNLTAHIILHRSIVLVVQGNVTYTLFGGNNERRRRRREGMRKRTRNLVGKITWL